MTLADRVDPITAAASCLHCGSPAPPDQRFCCSGCDAAFALIQDLGLGRYYRDRVLDAAVAAPRPDLSGREPLELDRFVDAVGDRRELTLAVDGLQCGACVWLIERVLAQQPGLLHGRLNMTSRRLHLVWRGETAAAAGYVAAVEALGYRLAPFEPAALAASRDASGRALLRALAVAAFAAGNVMLIALGTWLGAAEGMGPATRGMLHWLAALIALPAIAYAGRPFFASAWAALRRGGTNMDVPVSIGVLLVSGLSLWQTAAGGTQTYFESATMLLFFLLVGRLLDHRARGKARAAAEHLLTWRSVEVTVLRLDGSTVRRAQADIVAGDLVLVGIGERIGVDGVVERGRSMLDASLVTGESLPQDAGPGHAVYAGTLNLDGALTVRVTAAGAQTMLAECVRLIEAAEARRGRLVVLADRVARAFAPAVHGCALATFLVWTVVLHAPVADALLAAAAVLIITCPCALALAVPAVQVIATGQLFRAGVLLKSATALERVGEVTAVCFDKTGTLTEPELRLSPTTDLEALGEAASMAACSKHPLARALCAAAGPVLVADGVREQPGAGLSRATPGSGGAARLGSARFCGVAALRSASPGPIPGPELWFTRPGCAPVRFTFTEHLRDDAAATVRRLRAMGLSVRLLSGDRIDAVQRVSTALGIADWRAGLTPAEKVAAIESWTAAGERVLMVGDGLNDGPALSAASVSASPSTAADLSQTVADLVYRSRTLAPVALVVETGRRARRVMRQNLGLALGYNVIMVPLAMAGLVTPWLAAAAMSLSSLLVMGNSARVWRSASEEGPAS